MTAARARLAVRVQPGARARGLVGRMADGSIKLRVTEPPEDGRANQSVRELIAERLGVRTAAVAVVRGAGSRSKTIEVTGITTGEAEARLARALEGGGTRGDGDDG